MIIDFRARAPFSGYAQSPLFTNLKQVERNTLVRTDEHSPEAAKQFSMQLFMEEAQRAAIDKLLVPVKRVLSNHNQALCDLVRKYPDKLIGMIGINVSDLNEAKKEIQDYVISGPCRGIILEPGQDSTPWFANSTWAFPLYEFCQANRVPIAFTFGGIMTKSLRYYDPLLIDDVAGAFPELKIALCHGGWPYVTECCQIAINRGNVWLAPDIYMVRSPGMNDYVMAANYLLKQRIIFASAWPILTLAGAIKSYRESGLTKESLPYVMGKNAADFLALEEKK